MQHLAVEGTLGTTVDVAYCGHCRAFWFEQFETLRLTRGSTLQIMKLIGDKTAAAPVAPLPTLSYCPYCNSRLLLAHDRQQNTAFQYWRCENGHGRFEAFIDFLREKNFIRPLTAEQLRELRENIQSINCSQCGASIDLTRDTACPHCGAALSILDAKKIAEIVQPAGAKGGRPGTPNGVDAAKIAEVIRITQQPTGLVETGLHGFMRWLADVLSSEV